MIKEYCGVLTKYKNDFVLMNNGEDIDLSKELNLFYMKDVPIHITISNSRRTLLNECSELYFDRNSKKEYKLHINDINIEKLLEDTVHDLVNVAIELEEDTYEARTTA